jgi:hypothetical protein
MAEPPLEVGTLQDTVTEAFPALATTDSGADGAVACGVALASLDWGDCPTAFTAVTCPFRGIRCL